MNATPDPKRTRDFTDLAVFRAVMAGAFCAYLLLAILGACLMAIYAFNLTGSLNTQGIVPALLESLASPANLFMSLPPLCAVGLVGVFVLANQKGDITTYRAAARAGAKTGAIAVAIVCVLLALPLLMNLEAVPRMLIFVAVTLPTMSLIGALSGLAARWAAGRPTIETTPQPA